MRAIYSDNDMHTVHVTCTHFVDTKVTPTFQPYFLQSTDSIISGGGYVGVPSLLACVAGIEGP